MLTLLSLQLPLMTPNVKSAHSAKQPDSSIKGRPGGILGSNQGSSLRILEAHREQKRFQFLLPAFKPQLQPLRGLRPRATQHGWT